MSTFFSAQSRKAWIAGVIAALLQPILNLLLGQNVLTLRTLLVAVISGVLAAVAVWATTNEDAPAATPASPAPAPVTAVETPVLPVAPPLATSYLQDEATKDFGGQSVSE